MRTTFRYVPADQARRNACSFEQINGLVQYLRSDIRRDAARSQYRLRGVASGGSAAEMRKSAGNLRTDRKIRRDGVHGLQHTVRCFRILVCRRFCGVSLCGRGAALPVYSAVCAFWRKSHLAKALALSVLPTLLFLACGVLLLHIPLIVFAAIFGYAHITISCKNVKYI